MGTPIRWLGIAVATVLAIIAGLGVLVFLAADEDRIRAALTERVEAIADARLRIDGNMSVELLPRPGITLEGLRLEAPAGSGQMLASAKSLRLGISLLPLLRGKLVCEQLRIASPRLELQRDAQGRGNWQNLLRSAAQPDSAATDAARDAPARDVDIRELRIEDALIGFQDATSGKRYEARLGTLRIDRPESGDQASLLSLEGSIETQTGENARALGIGLRSQISVNRAEQKLELRGTDIDLSPTGGHPIRVSLPLVQADTATHRVSLPEGTLSGEDVDASISLDADWQAAELTGRIDARRLDVLGLAGTNGIDIPHPINPDILTSVQLRTDFLWRQGSLQLTALDLLAGTLALGGELRWTPGGSQRMEATLNSPLIDLDYILPPELIPPDEPDEMQPASGSSSATRKEFTAQLRASIGELKSAGMALQSVESTVTLLPGSIRLDDVVSQLYGGKLHAAGSLDMEREGGLRIDAELDGVDAHRLLAATRGVEVLDGALNASANLQARGLSREQWIASLDGPIRLHIEKPVLHGISAEQSVCKAAAALNGEALERRFEPLTRLRALDANVDFRKGVGELQRLLATTQNMSLEGEGSIDLRQRRIALRLDARITGDMETLDHACRMNRRMQRVTWPIRCRGSLDADPADWCGIDKNDLLDITRQIAGDKLKDKLGDFLRRH